MSKRAFFTRREILIGVASIAAGARVARAMGQSSSQSPPQRPTFSAEVELVSVFVTVRGRDGYYREVTPHQ